MQYARQVQRPRQRRRRDRREGERSLVNICPCFQARIANEALKGHSRNPVSVSESLDGARQPYCFWSAVFP